MKTIRNGVFETNSSSTHSLTMCSESDMQKWKDGELYFAKYGDGFRTKEEIMAYYKSDIEDDSMTFDEYRVDDEPYLTYDEFFNDYDMMEYETFMSEYKTTSGETVVAFGYHGQDY